MNYLKSNLFIITIILTISIFYSSCTKDEVVKQTHTVETNNELVNTLSNRMPSKNWEDLTAQQQADFARFLGRLWGDGVPNDLNNLTGSKFTGKSTKHNEIYDRLKNVFDLPKNNTRKNMPNFYDYWVDALPGNKPGDPQILREAVQNPNFIAGLIDAEGGTGHQAGTRYLIEDQTYAPSHPDESRDWGILNFGPNRIIQLFSLLEDSYGFTNTKIRIGNTEFFYAQKEEAIQELLERYNQAKVMNENPATGSTGFTVKIFINPAHFDELRSYGYWENQNCNNDDCKFRSPAPDDASLNILTGNFPDILSENPDCFQILHMENNMVISSDLELVPISQNNSLCWSTINVDGEYFRIVSNKNGKWLKAHNSMELGLVSDQNTGWQTLWKKKLFADGNFYLINKKFKDDYLRADINKTKVKLGVKGKQAKWIFSSIN